MYLGQAKKKPDYPQFQESMQKELDDHTNRENWKLCQLQELPPSAFVLLAVWKWKACINITGSKQIKGQHYKQTHSPVVAWPTTRFFLVQSLLNGRHTKQLDFVLVFMQAKVEHEL
jgi:hypothetical protein